MQSQGESCKLHTLNIPITLILDVDKKCLHTTLALFVDLKLRAGDKSEIDFNELIFKTLAIDLGIKTEITIEKHFNFLIKSKWVTVNSKRKVYHLKSFKWIHKKVIDSHEELYSPKAVMWEQRLDLSTFKAFMYASIITHFGVSKQAYEYYQQKRNGVNTESPVKSPRLDSNTFGFELPMRYFNKAYGISIGKASKMKKVAEKHGYLVIQEQNQIIRSNTPYSEFKLFKKFSEDSGIHFYKKDMIYKRGINHFKSNIKLRKTRAYAV